MSRGLQALAVFVVGAGILLVAEATALRVVGVVVMLAGVALGTFAIATPEFLSGDADERHPDR